MSTHSQIAWRDALDLKIREEFRAPVISNHALAIALIQLLDKAEYAGRPVRLPRSEVDRKTFFSARQALIDRGALLPERGLPNSLLRIPGRKDASPGEVMCAIDPFGHVAFLSAMEFHGLTNRLPRILYFVTFDAVSWRQQALQRMQRELGDLLAVFNDADLPPLQYSSIKRLNGVVIETLRTKDAGDWRHALDGALRVTGVGRTFLDMIKRPELCGGIRHVIEVFEEHALTYLNAIVAEFNTHGGKIDCVRAGYILNERCGIDRAEIDAWIVHASRGGSRKLDAQAEYSPDFSEKWSLSINA
jgi:hypothetical protein